MKKRNAYWKLGLFLAVVSAFAGLLISVIHSYTEPIIRQRAIALEEKNLEKLFPNGKFQLLKKEKEEGVLAVYRVENQGYVVKLQDTGYNSSTPIVVLVALSEEGKTVGFETLQQQETSGFGASCFERDFVEKTYVNQNKEQAIDGLTGATKTSNALRRILAKAFRAIEK